MVNSISGNLQPVPPEAGLLNQVEQRQGGPAIEKIGTNASEKAAQAGGLTLVDEATISDAAKKACAQDKEALRLGRMAQRIQEPYNGEKVEQFRSLLDSDRIDEYLNNIQPEALADSVLKSPSGAFLRQ